METRLTKLNIGSISTSSSAASAVRRVLDFVRAINRVTPGDQRRKHIC
jgi:hypothetical protein